MEGDRLDSNNPHDDDDYIYPLSTTTSPCLQKAAAYPSATTTLNTPTVTMTTEAFGAHP